MDCPDCRTETIRFDVPAEYREYVPGDEAAVAFCPHCLTLSPADDAPETPSFDAAPDAFPTDPDAAVPLAILLGLLDNLALYRSEISSLLEDVERAGVDPLLVLDRLATDPAVETDLDLTGRRRQLEQLL